MKVLRFLHCCGTLVCLFFPPMQAQSNAPSKRFVLNADYSRFWQDDSTAYLEISTAIYPNLTTLTRDTSGYRGKVELSISIQNRPTGALVSNGRFTIPIHFADSMTLAKTTTLVNETTYSLRCGSYTVSVLSQDSFDPSRRDSSSFPVDVVKRPDAPVLSDIELCSAISESSDQKDPFYKNSYRTIPNPSCVFGSTTQPVAFTYMELYNLSPDTIYAIKVRVTDAKGDVKKQRMHLRRSPKPNVVDVAALNVTSISSGKYNYEVVLSDTAGREIARSQRPIFLYNPNVESTAAASLSARGAEFAGMSAEELEKEFQTAQYIAPPEDIEAFEKLTTVEARREFLAKFWTKIENSESGRSNLTRTVYLQRVQIANERFKGFPREGWRTDRGRVYILYGEPDETERHPSSQDSKPYEIWSYHQIEGGVQFVFIDLTGLNEYILVHSTKRGEVQDATWQQFLR
jgi:GWxTD domain-containing protein